MNRARNVLPDEASWLRIERAPGETLRAGLERTLRDAIREGSLRAGIRLPSSRALASHLGVSRGVTSDVYAQLEAQGFLVVRSRSAPTVADVPTPVEPTAPPAEPAARRPRFDMSASTPDLTLFPVGRWVRAVTRAARHAPGVALDYGDPRGDPGLRAVLADHLGRTRGVVAEPERIVICQGYRQGVDVLTRALTARGPVRVAVEDPSTPSQWELLALGGAHVAGCPVDEEGLEVERLDADAVLVTPAHQMPTGVVLSGRRRRELLAWARERPGLIVEDDYDAEFRYDREPVRALQGLDPERVAYLGTVSKTLAPALRIGWLVLPEPLADEAARVKELMDRCSPVIDQIALRHLIEDGDYDRHLRRARGVYHRRRDRLTDALERHLPGLRVAGVTAGMHVLVHLPDGTDDAAVAQAALEMGVQVNPLSRSLLDRDDLTGLVLGYGRIADVAIDRATAVVARAVKAAMSPAASAGLMG
ncbi:MAG TPA: PLP-dependent aminotransferase family protein [Miltoncostaeaceae bacterium]|nr:PLP-dependent aminotransferase family protein [Miltoncostaeaceae bacterium]